MSKINTIEDDEIFWEPTVEEKREMGKKFREEKEAKKSKSKHLDAGPQLKKTFHVKDLNKIHPKTDTQGAVCRAWRETDKHLFLKGSAGTGKTFLACGLGFEHVLNPSYGYEKLIIVRSVVPSREVGYLPGNLEEKTEVFETPYIGICNELFGWANSYKNLKELGKLEFTTTSYLRGITLNNCIVIAEEIQNYNFGELDTLVTRIGENSRIIFAGDSHQNDLLNKRNEVSGFNEFHNIISTMDEDFSVHSFGHNDIVRSGLVKRYLIRKETYFINHDEQ